MVPWTVSAVRNGDVQEPSMFPYKPRPAEQILNEAWTRHADSKASVTSKGRQPSAFRHHVGLSRFQFGDGEYQASVASFQKYHEKQPEEEPLPDMQALVQATRTMSRSVRNGNFVGGVATAGQGGGQRSGPPRSLASLRRRHSTGDHLLLASLSNPVGDGIAIEGHTAVEELNEPDKTDDDEDVRNDNGDGYDDRDHEYSGRMTATSNAESDTDEYDSRGGGGGGSYEYGMTPTLLSTTSSVHTMAPTILRRQSVSSNLSGSGGGGGGGGGSGAGFDNGGHRVGFLPSRLSAVDALVREYGINGSGGGGCVSSNGGGEDLSGSHALHISGRESMPGRSPSRLCTTDCAGGFGRRSHCGDAGTAASLHRPAVRRATLCVLTPPAPPLPPEPGCTDVTELSKSASESVTSSDRVNQMLHDLRIAKRPDTNCMRPQLRKTRAAAAAAAAAAASGGGGGAGEAAAAPAASATGSRSRRSSCTIQFEPSVTTMAAAAAAASDSGPRALGLASAASRTKREACVPPLRFQAAATAAAAGSGPPSSPSPSASPRQAALFGTADRSPAISQRQLSVLLYDSLDDELLMALRSGPSISTSQAVTAAATGASSPASATAPSPPLSSPSQAARWSNQLPLPSETAFGGGGDAVPGAVGAVNTTEVMQAPFRSKSQTAVGHSAPAQTRASGPGPLGGWTSKPPQRKSGRLSTPSSSCSLAGASSFPHSVHFAAGDATAADTSAACRTASETSVGYSFGAAGDESSSGGGGGSSSVGLIRSSGHRFVWSGGTHPTGTNANTSASAGGSAGGGGVSAREPGSGAAEGSNPVAPRPPDQGPRAQAGPRPVGRLLGGLFGGPRRDSSGGLKHHS